MKAFVKPVRYKAETVAAYLAEHAPLNGVNHKQLAMAIWPIRAPGKTTLIGLLKQLKADGLITIQPLGRNGMNIQYTPGIRFPAQQAETGGDNATGIGSNGDNGMSELSTVLVPDKVITALELFDVINECRARCGEKAKDRSNFLRALEQELEINLYDKSQKNFNDKINNLGGFGKGRRVKRNPDLTYEQALQMAMRESKLVRQAVIEILKRQQSELIALRAIEVIKDNALAAEYLADNQQPALAMERHTMAEREYKNTSRVHASELAKGRAVKRILKRSEIKIRALIQPDLFD